MIKRLLLFTLLLSLGFGAYAQLKIGVNAGIPTGPLADAYNFSLGADVYYMFGKNPDAIFKAGATAGFLNYFGGEITILGIPIEIDDIQFFPVAAAGRFTLFKFLTIGADLGFGIALIDDIEGGIYWRSVLGIDLGNRLEINMFYHNNSIEEIGIGSVGAGLLFEF